MSGRDIEAALHAYPGLRSLQELLTAGRPWSGGWVTTSRGTQLLVFVRLWPDASVDMLMIYDDTNARGERRNPVRESVWERTGTVGDVADRLRELPAPGEPGAPVRVIAQAPSLRDL